MRSRGVLALAVMLQVAFSVITAKSATVRSNETVHMSYPDAATRTQFLNQLQTLWMNELNQFQLVEPPEIEFLSEEKNVGTMPANLGGQSANKVSYRIYGSTALDFDFETERKAVQEATMAAHMGPIAFSLDGESHDSGDLVQGVAKPDTGPVKPFSDESTVYLQYEREKTPLLTQVADIWKSVLAGTPSSDLSITIIKTNLFKLTGLATFTTSPTG